MIFSDHFFLIYFFPVFLALYYLSFALTRKFFLPNVIVAAGSLLFYASFGVHNLSILLVPLVLDYGLGRAIGGTKKKRLKRLLLIAGVLFNLALLFYFKYSQFAAQQLLHLYGSAFIQRLSVTTIALPIGISFIVFQRISYLSDIYTKKIKPAKNFLHYSVYALLFPHLISGPIVRYAEIHQELKKRKIDYVNFFRGLLFFSIGLFLKVMVADQLFLVEDHLAPQLSALTALLAAILVSTFSLRIYFDFLGYSLMAIGIAAFLGFHFPANFDSPYIAGSITAFWRRWNISLSSWIRDYLYIPLGGSRRRTLVTLRNIMISMVFAGIWHGAGWNFIIWGAFHGAILCLERLLPVTLGRIPLRLRQLLSLTMVTLLWVPFRFTKLEEIMTIFRSLLNLQYEPFAARTHNIIFASLPALVLAALWIICFRERDISKIKPSLPKLAMATALLFLGVGYALSHRTVSFIYFQF